MRKTSDLQTTNLILDTLKDMRSKLINDFLNENHLLYEPMFKYEKSPELTNLSIDKYFVMWIEDHWLLIQKHINENNIDRKEKTALEEKFAELLIQYLSSWKSSYNKGNIVSIKIISKFKEGLEHLIKFGEKDEANYQRLNYLQQKHNVIFERLFKQVENEGGK